MASSSVAAGIRVEDLTAYLGSSGWVRRKDYPRTDVVVFEGPRDDAGRPINCVFPASTHARAFQADVERVLRSVALLEEREPGEIAREVLRPEMDRLRVRLVSEAAASGSVPLTAATEVVTSLKDLMVAGACSESQPKPFYAKATKASVDFARTCRFGQTESGSFVLNIEAPVSPVFPQAGVGAPFARRVMNRIMRGLGRVHQAVMEGRPDALLLDAGYRDGLNANMFEALLPLRSTAEDLRIEVRATFSRLAPADPLVPRLVEIEARSFDYMDGAARALRNSEESKPRDLQGLIVKLADEPDEQDEEDAPLPSDVDRLVTLRFIDNGRRQHARFQLDPDDYRAACDAHRDHRRVLVSGTLERVGKQWRLLDVTRFEVMAGSDASL